MATWQKGMIYASELNLFMGGLSGGIIMWVEAFLNSPLLVVQSTPAVHVVVSSSL